MSKPHVVNNSQCNNEWYTPQHIIFRARTVMGGTIDLDPASSEIANRTVRAKRYWTIQDNALDRDWSSETLWLNPPYGRGLIGRFVEKAVYEYNNRPINHMMILVNNATEIRWFQALADLEDDSLSVCFLRGRVRFLNAAGIQAKTPLQGQAVVYAGWNFSTFKNQFSEIGWVMQRA